GPVKFVLSGSGHIAGVVNPPAAGKYQFWTNDNIKDVTLSDWLKAAQEHQGSWWPNWREWLTSIDAEQVPARAVGTEAMPPIEDAPGSYVRGRAWRTAARFGITGRPAGTRFETRIEGGAYDARIVLADADGHFDGAVVDPLRDQSVPGSRPRRRDGQPLTQRQAARGMGHPPDVRARQRGREPRHLRAIGADPGGDRLFDQLDRLCLRGVFLDPRRTSD